MKTILLFALLGLAACDGSGNGAAEGETCETDEDCAEGLECHEHDDVMECEAHEDGEEHTDE